MKWINFSDALPNNHDEIFVSNGRYFIIEKKRLSTNLDCYKKYYAHHGRVFYWSYIYELPLPTFDVHTDEYINSSDIRWKHVNDLQPDFNHTLFLTNGKFLLLNYDKDATVLTLCMKYKHYFQFWCTPRDIPLPTGFVSNGVIKCPSNEDEFRSSIEVYDL